MFASLVYYSGSQQLRGVEIANGESFEPRLLPTRQALKLRSPDVPELDVDTI